MLGCNLILRVSILSVSFLSFIQFADSALHNPPTWELGELDAATTGQISHYSNTLRFKHGRFKSADIFEDIRAKAARPCTPFSDLSSGNKIVVTGGAGFVGSHLVDKLRELQYQSVKVVDNLWRGDLRNLCDSSGQCVIDIERDFCFLDLSNNNHAHSAIAGATVVFHLADVVAGIGYVFEHEHWIYHQNSKINSNVVEAVFNSTSVSSYIFVGTACSFPRELQSGYGVTGIHENQTYPADPESAYGWSKLIGEYEAELMLKASRKRGLSVGILRFHNVYGPRAEYTDPERSQALPSLIRKAILSPHEAFLLWGSGKQYRDFVYVSDAVAAVVATLEHGMNMGVIQIGTGTSTTLLDAANSIQELTTLCLNKTTSVQMDSTKRDGDLGRVAVLQKARDILNWTSKVAFSEGVARTYAWILNDIHSSNFHSHHEEGSACLEEQANKNAFSNGALKLDNQKPVLFSKGLRAWLPPKLPLEYYVGDFSCDHKKALPPSPVVTQNSVLVVAIASTRGRHITFPSFQEYVLNVLPCDLALSVATTDNGNFDSFRKAAKFVWEIEEPASNSLSGPPNYRHYYNDIARVCFGGRFTAEDARAVGTKYKGQWLGLITEAKHPAGSGMSIFYRWLALIEPLCSLQASCDHTVRLLLHPAASTSV